MYNTTENYNTDYNRKRSDEQLELKTLNREHIYIFYFFEYFKPKFNFTTYKITGNDWGRYDLISEKQYKTNKFYWVIQLLDSKQEFYELKYNYSILIPNKEDIKLYIELIDSIIYGEY